MSNTLEVDHGNGDVQRYPWDDGIKKRVSLDADEVAQLECGEILWRGDTAFDLLGDEYDAM